MPHQGSPFRLRNCGAFLNLCQRFTTNKQLPLLFRLYWPSTWDLSDPQERKHIFYVDPINFSLFRTLEKARSLSQCTARPVSHVAKIPPRLSPIGLFATHLFPLHWSEENLNLRCFSNNQKLLSFASAVQGKEKRDGWRCWGGFNHFGVARF